MLVIHRISELQSQLQCERQQGHTIGFVPTMGALHEGHASLVRRSVNENDVTVVSKLFSYTNPDRAYFGEKDYQQIAVIRRMVADQGFKVEIVPCPVIREESGLARSSRNTLLSADEHILAANIYRVMKESLTLGYSVQQTHDYVVDNINAIEGLEVQYFSIVDGDSLAEVHSWEDAESIVGCITVFCGSQPIRLIDHIRYK